MRGFHPNQAPEAGRPPTTPPSPKAAEHRRPPAKRQAGEGRVRPRGFVSGPGTPTSDSIPARLSDGEYVLPADTVQAVGVESLDALRAATHDPARGFSGERDGEFFFAGGGIVDEERASGLRPGYATARDANAAGMQARQAEMAANRASVQSHVDSGEAGQRRDDFMSALAARTQRANIRPDRTNPDNVGISRPGGLLPDGVEMMGRSNEAYTPGRVTGNVPGDANMPARDVGAARGLLPDLSQNAGATPGNAPGAAPGAAPSAAPAATGAAVNSADKPASDQAAQPAADVKAPATPDPEPDEAATTEPEQAREVAPGVFRHGRGQYSDSAAGMGFAPGFTGQPSGQNIAAADGLVRRSDADVAGRVRAMQGAQAGDRGFQPYRPGPSASELAQQLADPFSRLGGARRNYQMAMQSALERDRPRGARGRLRSETDALARGMQGFDAQVLGSGQHRDTVERYTADVREQGVNQRAAATHALEAQKLQQQAQGLGFESEAQRLQIQQAQRQAGILAQYDAAKTDEERAALAKRFPDVFGKQDSRPLKDNFMAVGGGQEWDAQAGVMRNVPQRLVDLRTSQEVGGQQQDGGSSGIPSVGDVRGGYRYKGGNPNNQASWQKV